MTEPCLKRQKVDEDSKLDPIFKQFFKDKKRLSYLELAAEANKKGYNNMNLCLKKIEATDACSEVSFSSATIRTAVNEKAGDSGSFVAGHIFQYGIYALEKYVKMGKMPKEKLPRIALAKLLSFLSEIDHSALLEKEDYEEGEWAVIIGQHLLSKLTVNNKYIFDAYNVPFEKCPCREHDDIVGEPGDTSYGCLKAWLGKADIILEDTLPVTVLTEPSDSQSDSLPVDSASSAKFKDTEKFANQLMAQTIVFSFLQRKFKGKLKSCLVPGIRISNNNLYVNFYDSEHDVLLVSDVLPMWQGNRLIIDRIVFLWLTLNYRYFCSGVTEQMKQYPSEFFNMVGPYLKVYQVEVIMPAHRKETEDSDSQNWSIFPGAPMPPGSPPFELIDIDFSD